MAELVLANVNDAVVRELQARAYFHGRTLEEEAKAILMSALRGNGRRDWAAVDAIYDRLSASGGTFSDSAELLRDDRDR